MNINSLALVKLTDHVDIKPYYENKKLKNTDMLKIPEVFERDGDFIQFTQSFLQNRF